jgi:NDP-mannose synthase
MGPQMNANERKGVRAVILAGGLGTRLRPFTTVLPKPLMPVGEYPIIEILIRQLRHYGVRDLTIAVGYLGPLIEAYCGDGSRWGVRIRYSREEGRLGTAGPLTLVDGFEATTVIVNGDLLTDLNFARMIEFHRAQQAVITVGAFDREEQTGLGVLHTDAAGRITAYEEKPVHHYLVSMGAYVVEPEVLTLMERGRHCDFPDLVQRALAAGHPVIAFRETGFWLDIGRIDDYQIGVERFHELRARLLPDE